MKKQIAQVMKVLSQKELTNIYIVTLCLLVVALFTLNLVRGYVPQLYSDSAIYAHLAWFFTQGNIDKAVHMWWQPLYPLLGSLFFVYFQDIPSALFYVSVWSGILLFIPVFIITYEATKNRFTAIFAGFLASFHPQLVKSYYNLLTENIFITLLMFSVMFAVLLISRKKLIYAFIYGLTVGLTYIARGDALLSFQIFLLFGLVMTLFKKLKKLFYIEMLVISIIAFFIAASPYLYFNYQKFGFLNLGAKFNAVKNMPAYFSPQRNLTSTYAQDVWVLEDPNYDSGFFHKPYDYYKNREELVRDSVTRFWRYVDLFRENENSWVILAALLGFIITSYYFLRYFIAGFFLNFLAILGFLISLLFLPSADFRYAFWLYPLFSIFTAILIFICNKLILKKISKKGISFMVMVILNLVILSFYFDIYKASFSSPGHTESNSGVRKLAGDYIKHLKPNARIMTRREAITYYAKGQIIYIPTSIDINDLERYAKLYKTDYIVADRETFSQDTLLKNLNDENQAPDWLVPVKVLDLGYPKTIIYEVKY